MIHTHFKLQLSIFKLETMILHGSNLVISADGSVLAASKTCSLNVDTEKIKVSSSVDGKWEHSITGLKSWSLTTNHLLEAGGYDCVIKALAVANHGNGTPQASHVSIGGSAYPVQERGLNLIRLNPATYIPMTGTWLNYDTYGDMEGESESLENYISNIDRDFLAVIVSHDAFGMTQDLKDAIEDYLYVDLTGVPLTAERGSLVVIGGEGVGDRGIAMYAAPATGSQGRTAHATAYMLGGSVVPYTPLRDAVLRVGKTFSISVQVDGMPSDRLTGQAHCKSFKCQATKGNLLTGSFTWEGTGPLF